MSPPTDDSRADDPRADDPRAGRLRQARERAGYADAGQAAEAFGWPDYAADESGGRPLTPARARLYAHAFHVEPDWLLSGEGEPAASTPTPGRPADELAERIARLSDAQRAALTELLRAMQDG